MNITAKYTTQSHAIGILVIDGSSWVGPLPPQAGDLRPIYDAWIAKGNAPAPYAPPAPLSAMTYKADIWRRATDAEAATIDAQISAQPVKIRNLFRDAQHLDHADPYFVQLKAGFVAAFGAARANELLAPSV